MVEHISFFVVVVVCFVFVKHANRLPNSKRKAFNRNRVDMILNSANVNGFLDLKQLNYPCSQNFIYRVGNSGLFES